MILHTVYTYYTVVLSPVSGLADTLQLVRRCDIKKQKAQEPGKLDQNLQ